MPASLFSEMERNTSNGLEDQRALQLAFELSMIGFDSGNGDPASGDSLTPGFPEDTRGKKSQNMTECVPVPSSEHVAEIVGRQGCKIKALRAKTNTYIKTPVRGEEPVFVVTGRKEDVAKAKREILSAAEHFSQIRASRKNNLGGSIGTSGNPPGPPTNVPGQITLQVRVPYRVVGLVVGPKGATIKRIQQQTHTYIVTPSRDKEPVFEVTGMPDNVETAKKEIEAHIASRTGSGILPATLNANGNGLIPNGIMDESQDILASLYKSGLGSLFSYLDVNLPASSASASDPVGFPIMTTSTGSSGAFSSGSSSGSCSSSSSLSGGGQTSRLGDLVSIWGSGGSSLDRDEGLGDSPSFDTATASSSIWSFPAVSTTRPSPTASASPTDSLSSICAAQSSGSGSPPSRRECMVCSEKEVDAALVPCGHNLFCLDCATRVTESQCPVCQLPVVQAIRIFH